MATFIVGYGIIFLVVAFIVFSILVIIDPFIALTVGINENGFVYRTPTNFVQNVYLGVAGIITALVVLKKKNKKDKPSKKPNVAKK